MWLEVTCLAFLPLLAKPKTGNFALSGKQDFQNNNRDEKHSVNPYTCFPPFLDVFTFSGDIVCS